MATNGAYQPLRLLFSLAVISLAEVATLASPSV